MQPHCAGAKGIEAVTPQAANACVHSEANRLVWRPRSNSEKPDPNKKMPTVFLATPKKVGIFFNGVSPYLFITLVLVI
jgi:hypothetical protein